VNWEWVVRHLVYPNTREGYTWKEEDWWLCIYSNPSFHPEPMGGFLEWGYHVGAAWNTYSDFLVEPLDIMYHQVRRTRDRNKRFEIYKRANDYIADQATWIFTLSPMGLYGVNKELDFVQQVSWLLYLEYSSVTDNHWSVKGRNN
jgi:ABC-type transport system substrate-binding protein